METRLQASNEKEERQLSENQCGMETHYDVDYTSAILVEREPMWDGNRK
jgi:hypothetical protein